MIYIILYIIGCLLSYGRANASNHEIPSIYRDGKDEYLLIATGLSWVGFGLGIYGYIVEKEKYFFRF